MLHTVNMVDLYMFKPILLVEDDPNDIELVTMALQRNHLANQMVVVRDGAEALEYLQCNGAYADREPGNPLLVLLDINLPKINGLEVLSAIRQSPGLSDVPVVMMTASDAHSDLVESHLLGVNGYVSKPVNFHEFVRVIADVGMGWALVKAGVAQE